MTDEELEELLLGEDTSGEATHDPISPVLARSGPEQIQFDNDTAIYVCEGEGMQIVVEIWRNADMVRATVRTASFGSLSVHRARLVVLGPCGRVAGFEIDLGAPHSTIECEAPVINVNDNPTQPWMAYLVVYGHPS